MPADQNINSFDELKVALDSALRNGAASPEAVDFSPYPPMTSRNTIRTCRSMKPLKSATTPTRTFGTLVDTMTSMTRRGIKSRPR